MSARLFVFLIIGNVALVAAVLMLTSMLLRVIL
jgi:hypothetical protein